MDGRDARPAAQVTSATLSRDVEVELRTAASGIGNLNMVVLPPHERGGRSMYGPGDVDAVRLAREAGVNAAFLYKAANREYLHEYSAGWAIEFAIALAEQRSNRLPAHLTGSMTLTKTLAEKHTLAPDWSMSVVGAGQ